MKTSRSMRALALTIGLLLAGCASDDSARPKAREGSLFRDPYNYQPDTSKVDVTGGDLGHFDKKAFMRDMDSVFNP